MPLVRPNDRVRRSLRLGILDGAGFSVMLGLTQNYITPFALALKATTTQIGLLTSIPNLAAAAVQLIAPRLAEKAGSRKGLILPVVLLHALLWLPILLVPFVFSHGQVWWLIGFVALSTVLGALANPSWGSMMADLVPASMRGRYFSFRGRINVIITLLFGLIAGLILQFFSKEVFTGFAILFGGALVFRFVSWYFLTGIFEPRISSRETKSANPLKSIRLLKSTNLGRFTIYVALISLTTNIAGPFFSVYMLRDLGFSYTTYMIIISTHALANLLSQTIWGRIADRAGNIMVIKITSFLLPCIPLLWLFSYDLPYLMMAEVLSGATWAGFNLASVNFVYDASEKDNRTEKIAIFNAINGTAVCLGALIGGYLAPNLPPLFGFEFRSLFMTSGLLRAFVVALMLRTFAEVRTVNRLNWKQALFGR